jgi:hypothetical protein
VSSSSAAFFFLLPPLTPFVVGWLDSRVGKDETGVAACDGVVPAEAGVDASYGCIISMNPAMQTARRSAVPSTYPQKTGRASTEYPVHIADLSLAPCRRARSTSRRGSRCALDIVVEAFDNVSRAGLFKVLCLNSQNVVFKLLLRTK